MVRVMSKDSPSARKTSFGFAEIAEEDKQPRVNAVFDSVAGRYDLMNDLMSGGLHRLWKATLIDMLSLPRRSTRCFRLIDVAGGTGDITLRFLDRSRPYGHATLCDINPAMVEQARARVAAAGHGDRTEVTVANAERLPFDDRAFDAFTIAFGMRNVTRIDAALGEAFRVLKPGGRFLCLEFSTVKMPGLDALYDAYSFTAIPALGKLVTGDGAAYRYLVESIRRFPSQRRFAGMIEAAGFERVTFRNLSGGIVAIHSGWRL